MMRNVVQVFVYIEYLSIIGIDAKPLDGAIYFVQETELGEVPYLASLGVPMSSVLKNHYHLCGGVRISNDRILTTNSCFKMVKMMHEEYRNIGVKLGSGDLKLNQPYFIENPRRQHTVSYNDWLALQNRGYLSVPEDYNVVALKLTQSAPIEPPQISRRILNLPGEQVTIVGWPRTVEGYYVQHANKAQLTVNNQRQYNIFPLRSGIEGAVSIHPGDEGAPVFYDNKLIGLTSTVLPRPGAESLFHHIGDFHDFIRSFQGQPSH